MVFVLLQMVFLNFNSYSLLVCSIREKLHLTLKTKKKLGRLGKVIAIGERGYNMSQFNSTETKY